MLSNKDIRFLLQKLQTSTLHSDTTTYVYVSTSLRKGLGVTATLLDYAQTENLHKVQEQGSSLEKEITTNGVKRLVRDPTKKPYAANPSKGTMRVLEYVYQYNYTPNQ